MNNPNPSFNLWTEKPGAILLLDVNKYMCMVKVMVYNSEPIRKPPQIPESADRSMWRAIMTHTIVLISPKPHQSTSTIMTISLGK